MAADGDGDLMQGEEKTSGELEVAEDAGRRMREGLRTEREIERSSSIAHFGNLTQDEFWASEHRQFLNDVNDGLNHPVTWAPERGLVSPGSNHDH